MRYDLTDITLVVDRSGSMYNCLADSEGGINSFIESQKNQPGECLFTLVEFDTEYDFVHKGVNINDVPHYTFKPRGWTALRDAMGRAMNETGARLAAMPESERPGLVLFVVVTDGRDNRSTEFSKERIRKMVDEQENVYSWKFTYLGAHKDAFTDAFDLGFRFENTAKYAHKMSQTAYDTLGAQAINMRCACGACGPQGPGGSKGVSGFSYSEAERSGMAGK
jgi:hypothetical protein